MSTDRKRGQKPLEPGALRRRAPVERWGIETTADLKPLTGALGQERAEEALAFGIEMLAQGYNLFAIGPPQLGKHAIIEGRLREAAQNEAAPPDLVYVHHFEAPRRPRAMVLPAGRGRRLEAMVRRAVEAVQEAIPAALQGEDFQASQQVIEEGFRRRQDEAIEEIRAEAKEHQIAVIRTPSGVVMAPMDDGEVVAPAEFQERPKEERERFEANLKELHRRLETTMGRLPRWEQKRREQLESLERSTLEVVVNEALMEVRTEFAGVDAVEAHLTAMADDMIEHRRKFLEGEDLGSFAASLGPEMAGGGAAGEPEFLQRYGVNVLISSDPDGGAPVIREHHPTLENLVGRIDHQAHFGALRTDFSMIHAGALHRANGGFLVLDAREVLRQPFGWDQLKRALRSEAITIETPAQLATLVSTVSLEPEVFDLKVKVVLVADREIFELLRRFDPDVEDLFKVVVDFSEETERVDGDGDGIDRFARLLAGLIEEAEVPPFEARALGMVVEEASRMAGDAKKVSLKRESLRDVICESAHFAGSEAETVPLEAVEKALRARQMRQNRLKERVLDSISRQHVQIETTGSVVGQVNGLSVVMQGGHRFGIPSRITASVRLGAGEVVDIAREVAMGGPIHSRGVLILNGYLGRTFGQKRPLSLQASLVFEQTYGPVDGDSASLAETVALLSALSEVPVKQNLAITGAIDQRGRVQAVGGINEKIEGFFDTCQSMGEVDGQGVIIPASNREHLMLRPDVIEAAEAGRFHVYLARRLEDAIEILTGVAAGEADSEGNFDPVSVLGRVDGRLDRYAERIRDWQRRR